MLEAAAEWGVPPWELSGEKADGRVRFKWWYRYLVSRQERARAGELKAR